VAYSFPMSKKERKIQRQANLRRPSVKKNTPDSKPAFQGELRKDLSKDSPNSPAPYVRHTGQNMRVPPHQRHNTKTPNSTALWIFGKHPVLAALSNPKRIVKRLLVTKRGADQYLDDFRHINDNIRPLTPEIILPDVMEKILPLDCVYQNIALHTEALPEISLESCCTIKPGEAHLVLLLDQLTDPHNVGAIIRSAAAFGARAIISTDRNSPPESGTLAKAASGALEILPWVRVTNLSHTLDSLAEMGYWRLGLDGTADLSITQADFGKNIALVMGAEGKGLRKGTQSHCDALIKLPIKRAVESLNVSNAAAIALYAFSE